MRRPHSVKARSTCTSTAARTGATCPRAVWEYKLGGYQVLKKWLSYRERKVLGRDMKPEEVAHFRDTARRIAAILLLTAS